MGEKNLISFKQGEELLKAQEEKQKAPKPEDKAFSEIKIDLLDQ